MQLPLRFPPLLIAVAGSRIVSFSAARRGILFDNARPPTSRLIMLSLATL
jgi:hypothetical protein